MDGHGHVMEIFGCSFRGQGVTEMMSRGLVRDIMTKMGMMHHYY